MFFTDGVDSGPQGFLNIMRPSEPAADPDIHPDAEPQTGASDAETVHPPGDSEQYTDADTVIADRLAASMEADGIDVPTEPEEREEPPTGGGVDLDALTPEEWRALAEEALALKAAETETTRESRKSAVKAKVEEAEANAVAQVLEQFGQQVLAKSVTHYYGSEGQLAQRVSSIVRASERADNPAQFIIDNVLVAAQRVVESQRKHETEQEGAWNQRAIDAALAARARVPELRQYYAEELATTYNLPETMIADINSDTRDIAHFEARAKELAGMGNFAAKERQQSRQHQQKAASAALRAAPVRTSSSGRPAGGKPPAYKGSAQEGWRLIQLKRGQ